MIDLATVRKMATLARLELSDDRAQQMARELSAILTHVDSIRTAPVDQLPITSSAQGAEGLRDDVVADSLPIETVLATAPDHAGRLLRVARVLSED